MLIFKFYAAKNSKTGEGAQRQGNAEKNKPVAALNKFGLRKAFPKFIFLFFEQNRMCALDERRCRYLCNGKLYMTSPEKMT